MSIVHRTLVHHGPTRGFNNPANHDLLVAGIAHTLPPATAAGAPNVSPCSANRNERADDEGAANCVRIDDGQTLDYRTVCAAIADGGFAGYLANEFIPIRDPLTSLAETVRICDM